MRRWSAACRTTHLPATSTWRSSARLAWSLIYFYFWMICSISGELRVQLVMLKCVLVIFFLFVWYCGFITMPILKLMPFPFYFRFWLGMRTFCWNSRTCLAPGTTTWSLDYSTATHQSNPLNYISMHRCASLRLLQCPSILPLIDSSYRSSTSLCFFF